MRLALALALLAACDRPPAIPEPCRDTAIPFTPGGRPVSCEPGQVGAVDGASSALLCRCPK